MFKETILGHLQNKQTIGDEQFKDLFDARTGLGTIRIFAEVKHQGVYSRSKPICVARSSGSDYAGRLTEIFNLPYILGSGFIPHILLDTYPNLYPNGHAPIQHI